MELLKYIWSTFSCVCSVWGKCQNPKFVILPSLSRRIESQVWFKSIMVGRLGRIQYNSHDDEEFANVNVVVYSAYFWTFLSLKSLRSRGSRGSDDSMFFLIDMCSQNSHCASRFGDMPEVTRGTKMPWVQLSRSLFLIFSRLWDTLLASGSGELTNTRG